MSQSITKVYCHIQKVDIISLYVCFVVFFQLSEWLHRCPKIDDLGQVLGQRITQGGSYHRI